MHPALPLPTAHTRPAPTGRRPLAAAAAFGATLLTLSAPAPAQTFPHSCTASRACQDTACARPDLVFQFEATPSGLIAWDRASPGDRTTFTRVPGDGPATWTGRASDGSAVALLTRLAPDQAVLSLALLTHPDRGITLQLDCRAAAAPAPSPQQPARPPLTK
jgi:hypothetical protein